MAIAENTKYYKDISFGFNPQNPHPVTGDIIKKTDLDSIKQSIENLLNTKSTDRLFQPHIDIPLDDLLFETSAINEILIEDIIRNSLTHLEQRMNIIDIKITGDIEHNTYFIMLKFSMKTSPGNIKEIKTVLTP